jgi:hypothetical protein
MSDEYPTLLTLDEGAAARARALVEIGFYEEIAPNHFRLTEACIRWIVSWLPHVITVLIERRQPLVELQRENLDLRVYIEELKRGILSPHRATQTGDEEE